MKSHSPANAKLLMGGVKGLKMLGVWVFLMLNAKDLRKKQMQQDQQS